MARLSSVIVALALGLSNANVFFEDRFDSGMDNWVKSDWKSGDMGTWTHGPGEWFGNEDLAKGIITTDDLKHHAISAKMSSTASTTVKNSNITICPCFFGILLSKSSFVPLGSFSPTPVRLLPSCLCVR